MHRTVLHFLKKKKIAEKRIAGLTVASIYIICRSGNKFKNLVFIIKQISLNAFLT